MLTFLSWARDPTSALATGPAGGRAEGAATVTLTARGAGGAVSGTASRQVRFLLSGPADVAGLAASAIVRRYPAPGTLDHESDRCPYVELAEPALAWRYTPAATPGPTSANLHPWLVLVVGQEGSELALADSRVTIETAVQGGPHALGAPGTPYRFAHVQVDGAGHRTARVLCGRPLQGGTDYLAVVVPAFDEHGARSWAGTAPATVPVYDAWRFRTAVPAGSFEDLAARLHPGAAPASTGRAPLSYPRLPGAPGMEVLGSLVAAPGGEITEAPLPSEVADDLAALQLPARDSDGRPIVALPRYGEAWDATAPAQSTWGRTLNGDPRHRGVAGLGLEVAIQRQEDLVGDVLDHLGALQEARQRVRHAVMGVTVSRSLWRRRVPADPAGRLWFLGPALSRLPAARGSIGDLVTADDRTLARGTFSASARRILRSGPARTSHGAPPPDPRAVLGSANRMPPELPSTSDGLPLDRRAVSDFDVVRRRTAGAGRVPRTVLAAAVTSLLDGLDPGVRSAERLAGALGNAARGGRNAPWIQGLALLASSDAVALRSGPEPERTARRLSDEIVQLGSNLADRADDADPAALLAALSPLEPDDPVPSPVPIDALATGVAGAFDPMAERPPIVARVLATITGGIDATQPLAPPEPCVGLDRASWADLRAVAGDWLLPGVGQIPFDSVVPLQTNPRFVDAFLAGLNTQLLAELRWRNIPVATGCTPVRRFWDRVDPATGLAADDIAGLASWAAASTLGDATHRPPGTPAEDLVVAVRGDLFRRYPTTLVYLVAATGFDQDPPDAAARIFPGFQGRLSDEVAFFGFPGLDSVAVAGHWIVFEEPPAGYRFANDVATGAATGHEWAAATLARPVRVLIRGDSLVG